MTTSPLLRSTTPSRQSAHGPSFLRWAGSKRKSLALLGVNYRDISRHYVEPFAGSAALFFELQPQSGTLGDLNGHLINALRWVRDKPQDVHRLLLQIQRSPETYYASRSTFNSLRRFDLTQAVLFIYLNRNCFNGLWRTNLSGKFNVPFGGYEMGEYPPIELFVSCSNLLKKAKLKHQDFRKTIDEAQHNSFIYADPPYFSDEERVFVEYGKRSFDKNDLSALVDSLISAELRGCQIALTYNKSMKINGIPKHWKTTTFEVTRNVGGFSGTRRKQAEILYTSFPPIRESKCHDS